MQIYTSKRKQFSGLATIPHIRYALTKTTDLKILTRSKIKLK